MISAIGPYAGKESHNERCTMVRFVLAGPIPLGILLADVLAGTFESAYISKGNGVRTCTAKAQGMN